VIVDAPPLVLSKAQAAANIQGARDVRAQYVRPAWLDTREDER